MTDQFARDLVILRWQLPDGQKAIRFETPSSCVHRVGVDFLDNRPENEARQDAARLLKMNFSKL